MEQDIKNILGEYEKVDLITLLRTFKKEGIKNFIVVRKNKLEHLIKSYKELENKLSEYKTINDIAEEIKRTVTEEDLKEAIKEINDDYIPVSLVEEKIKGTKSKGICKNTDFCNNACFYYSTCNVLQELLEKRK